MPSAQRHSPLSHAAYVELLNSLREEALSSLRGAPVLKRRGGKSFWYDSYRVGRSVKTTYIGPDTPEVRDRLARVEAIKSEAALRRAERRRAVRILRAEGFLNLDATTGSLVAALAAAGTFRLGGTIVGTHAFRLYEGDLGIRLRLDQTALTNDLDVASLERLSLALEDTTSPPLTEVLSSLSFSPAPSLNPARSRRWRQGGGGIPPQPRRGLKTIHRRPHAPGPKQRRARPPLRSDAMPSHHGRKEPPMSPLH